jgi:uncharacterized membrane protein
MRLLQNKQFRLWLLAFVVVIGLTTTVCSVYAQTATKITANDALDQPFAGVKDMGSLTQAIFQLGIAACALTACIYIAIGAFYYFVAAGSNAKIAQQGKEKIQNAVIGLILALVSWIILNTIHPQFTDLKINEVETIKSGK